MKLVKVNIGVMIGVEFQEAMRMLVMGIGLWGYDIMNGNEEKGEIKMTNP